MIILVSDYCHIHSFNPIVRFRPLIWSSDSTPQSDLFSLYKGAMIRGLQNDIAISSRTSEKFMVGGVIIIQ